VTSDMIIRGLPGLETHTHTHTHTHTCTHTEPLVHYGLPPFSVIMKGSGRHSGRGVLKGREEGDGRIDLILQ